MDHWIFLLSLAASVCLALGLVFTTFGLRTLSPLVGATYSVPTSLVLFLCLAPLTIDWSGADWRAVAIFAGAGFLAGWAALALAFSILRRSWRIMTAPLRGRGETPNRGEA